MLVLTRKRDEEIIIYDQRTEPPTEIVRITVVEPRPTSVRLGIQAESHYRVIRSELAPEPTAATLDKTAVAAIPQPPTTPMLPGGVLPSRAARQAESDRHPRR